jgi:hypothetical protein
MELKKFLKTAKIVYRKNPKLKNLFKKDEFLARAKESYEAFMEIKALKGMPVPEFEEKYIKTNLASYGLIFGKGQEDEIVTIKYRKAGVPVIKEHIDGAVVLVPINGFETLGKDNMPIVSWNLNALAIINKQVVYINYI